MLKSARLALSFVVGLATYYFVFWGPFSLLSDVPGHWLLAFFGSFAAGVGAGYFTWRLTANADEKGVLATTFGGAVIVGGISFALGFFGPMIFAPGANQGPLLGILYTGPYGFVAGGVGGFFYGLFRWWRRVSGPPAARAADNARRAARDTSRSASGRNRAGAAGP